MGNKADTAVLLLSCPDQKGLVATVADFIYRNSGNIIHADQHADREAGVFVQRVEWELDGFAIKRASIADAFRPIAERFGMEWRLHFSDVRLRTAILVSKQAHCLYDLLARWEAGELPMEVPVIISNHADLELAANRFGVAFHHLAVTPETKGEQEQRMLAILEQERVDLVVLARYMQILSPRVVDRYPNRIINIHHSFLPAFAGARPYRQAYHRGVKTIGATAHYVTADLDQGPIIAQDVVQVSHRDSEASLMHKGRDLETVVLARAVGLHLHHRIVVHGNKTAVFD